MNDRLQLRRTFDSAAARYDRARPRYPDELVDALMQRSGLHTGDRVLEVGCGTGIATRQLADRGLRVVCVELGAQLAAVAREQLAGHPRVEVVHGDFESWRPPRAFDLVAAATAWHWIDPDTRYRRAWDALRPGGHLAFWMATHVFPAAGDPFFREIQDVYERIGRGMAPDAPWPEPGELPDSVGEIEASGLFCDAVALQFDWEVVYSAEGYVDLLETFSDHIAMTDEQRRALHDAIRERIARRRVPEVARHFGAVLHVARRRDDLSRSIEPGRTPPRS